MHKILKFQVGSLVAPANITPLSNNYLIPQSSKMSKLIRLNTPNISSLGTQYLNVSQPQIKPVDLNKISSAMAKTPKASGFNGLQSSLNQSSLIAPLNQSLSSISNAIAPKTPSLTNSIGSLGSSVISQINPTAGLANNVGDLAVSSIFGKDKSNPSDTGGQIVNQVANVGSMFGPIGMAAGVGVKALNALGTTKIKGNTMDDRTSQSTGFSGTIANNQEDKNISIFGNKSKQKNKVAKQQQKLNTISGILKRSDDAFETANNFDITNNQIDYTKGFRFGKEGIKLPEKKEVESIKLLLKKTESISSNKSNDKTLKFEKGGAVNIIPDGSLHAHNHNLSDVDDKFKDVTSKGLPVVSYDEGGNLVQAAEIEKEEIIFHKEVTDELEKLKKDGSEEAMIKAGKLLTKEIMENTIDYTKKMISDETTKD